MGDDKGIFGLTFDGTAHTIWLATEKRDALLATLRGWIRIGQQRGGIPFDEFQPTLSKLQHAFITVPAGKGLLLLFYSILAIELKFVFIHRTPRLLTADRLPRLSTRHYQHAYKMQISGSRVAKLHWHH